ncbi:MAG: hypothetical protein WAU01_00275 [Saprospiraceae bacterium]
MTIDNLIEIIKNFGIGQGLLIILLVGIMFFLYKQFGILFNKTLKSKDDEIKRLVEENREYRNMFKDLIKKDLNLPEKEIELELPNLPKIEKNK